MKSHSMPKIAVQTPFFPVRCLFLFISNTLVVFSRATRADRVQPTQATHSEPTLLLMTFRALALTLSLLLSLLSRKNTRR
jgi:hypothetical protein